MFTEGKYALCDEFSDVVRLSVGSNRNWLPLSSVSGSGSREGREEGADWGKGAVIEGRGLGCEGSGFSVVDELIAPKVSVSGVGDAVVSVGALTPLQVLGPAGVN